MIWVPQVCVICQNSLIVHLRTVHIFAFVFVTKENSENNYWILGNNMPVEIGGNVPMCVTYFEMHKHKMD